MRFRVVAVCAAVVLAVTAGGTSAGAAVPGTAVTATVPSAPTGVKAAAGNGSAQLTWVPPASTGGAAITGYLLTATPGGKTARSTAVTSFTVGGLTNGTAYTFTVAAVNSTGTGPTSAASMPVTPRPPTAPAPPTRVSASAGYQSATVDWAPPASDGGSPISQYTVTAQPGGATISTDGSTRQAVLTGLTNGTSYTLTVTASNLIGASPATSSSPTVPQQTVPGVPTALQVTGGTNGTTFTLTWSPPQTDGGTPVTGYVMRAQPLGTGAYAGNYVTASPTGGPQSTTFGDVTPGQSYRIELNAINAAGSGPLTTLGPITPDVTVGPTTIVLTDTSLAALSGVHTDGSLTFTNPPPQASALKAGDVLVAGISASTPSGLLRRVTSVTTSGSTTTVATSPAALDQALSDGELALGSTLSAAQVTSFQPSHAGVRLAAPDTTAAASGSLSSGLQVTVDSDLYKDTHGATVHVSGALTVTPTVTLTASVSPFGHTNAHFTASVQSKASINLTAQLSQTLTAGFPLGSATFTPITFMVGPVPVVLVPKLDLTLNASGTVTVGVSTAASETDTYGVDLTSNDGTVTATPINKHISSYTPPTLYDQATAKTGPMTQLSLLFYGVAGPYVTDQLWLPKLTASTTANPWWTMSAENIVGAGFKLSVLGHALADWNKTPLFDTVVPLANAGGPFMGVTITPNPAAVAPGTTLQLQATVQRTPIQTVTWAAAAGTISSTGLYTAPSTPGNYQITATSPASGLKPQTQGVLNIRVGGQPPAAPTKVTASSTSRGTATVTWTRPTDTGGLPLTSYQLSSTPPGATATASGSATTALVGGLTPGGTYQLIVTATNSAGTGPPSATSNAVLISDQDTTTTGTVQAWGYNLYGALGNGTTTNSSTPVQVSRLTGITAIAGGDDGSGPNNGYALRRDGTVWAWGYNLDGELGNGTNTDSSTPVQVSRLTGITAIAGGSRAAYALRGDGTVWAWGNNSDGQLGNGIATNASISTPVQVSGLTGVTAIAGGYFAGYALRGDGTVRAWGSNTYGELGNGTTTNSSTPVQVSGLTGVTAIAGGYLTGYALRGDGTVRAWGINGYGELGASPTTTPSSSTPVQVTGLTGITAIAGGTFTGYALCGDGTVRAWGHNGDGELGNGTTTDSSTPVQVSGLTGVTAIAGGGYIGYALLP